jgi:hypothetical protein
VSNLSTRMGEGREYGCEVLEKKEISQSAVKLYRTGEARIRVMLCNLRFCELRRSALR